MARLSVDAKTTSVSAPLGGWNARDSLAEMPIEDAVSIVNLWVQPTDVRIRLGYARRCTGFANNNPINTVMPYNGGSTQRLFAAQSTSIYDATGTTAVVQPLVLTSDKFQYTQTSTPGGIFLVAVNGADDAILFNGTNWIRSAKFTSGQTISSITVVGTTATITTATAHGLFDNNQITISGATPAALNGAWLITSVPTPTTATFTVPAGTGNATVVGTYSVAGYTGVDSATLLNINLFKNRLWFTPQFGTTVYFTDVNAVTGALSPFPLGSVFKRGGNVVAAGTWTLDAGSGVDDHLVFVTSEGEIAVYMGTNPADATMFSLRGVWQLGQAFTPRCVHKWGGDLLLLLQDGIVPLSSALQSSRLDPRVNLTDKIYQAISQSTSDFQNNFGWQIIYFPMVNMLILNVPTVYGIEQYCMNTISKAWTRFQGIQAYNFAQWQNKLYFGGNGFVGEFWGSPSDDGGNIQASVQQAFNYFGNRGQLKRFMLARPILLINAGQLARPGVNIGINFDYAFQNTLAPASFNPSLTGIGIWDNSTWNGGAVWGTGNLEVSKEWITISGIGYAAGLVMNLAMQGIDFRWTATDFVFEPGGVI